MRTYTDSSYAVMDVHKGTMGDIAMHEPWGGLEVLLSERRDGKTLVFRVEYDVDEERSRTLGYRHFDRVRLVELGATGEPTGRTFLSVPVHGEVWNDPNHPDKIRSSKRARDYSKDVSLSEIFSGGEIYRAIADAYGIAPLAGVFALQRALAEEAK
jgi:hypothetical protein